MPAANFISKSHSPSILNEGLPLNLGITGGCESTSKTLSAIIFSSPSFNCEELISMFGFRLGGNGKKLPIPLTATLGLLSQRMRSTSYPVRGMIEVSHFTRKEGLGFESCSGGG